MRRAILGWSISVLVLVLGLATAALVAENRRRGSELDLLQRWCEAQERKNELQRTMNARAEWTLLGQEPPPTLAVRAEVDA